MTDTLLLLLPFLLLLFCTVQSSQFYLNLTEAARELRVSRDKVLVWIKTEKLKAADVSRTPGTGRARWRISRSDLDDFLAGRAPKATTTVRRSRMKKPAGWVQYFGSGGEGR